MKIFLHPFRGGDRAQRMFKGWCSALGICVLGLGLQAQAQQPAGTYNVQTDGTAQGNGSNDDTAEIQAALNAAKAQGKDVYFPAGTYLVSGQIDVPNTTRILGDQGGVSLIRSATPNVRFGEPDNDGTTVGNLSVEDMFFLNISVFFTGIQKNNITIRRCVLATDQIHSENWFLCVLSRGDDNTIEDNVFLAGHDSGLWPGKWIKCISTYRNDRMTIQRNVFGLDLDNLSWMDQWEGYASWVNVESRLGTFKSQQSLPRRMGEIGGGMRLNECRETLVDKNIFHFDLDATNVPQDSNNLDVDHIIYATQATDLVITRNWMRGQPLSPGGGLKHRDTDGPGVIAANYLDDTPIIVYTYASDLVHGFKNQLIYNNWFNISKTNRPAGKGLRIGIEFQTTDTFTGENIKIASNTFDVDTSVLPESIAPINLEEGVTSPTDWIVYESNTYEDSGSIIPIVGLSGPYSHTSGAPPPGETAPYASMVIPVLNIPEYGEDPPANAAPVFSSDPLVETNATEGALYSNSIADNASDVDGDPMSFARMADGPAWLSVSGDGTLSGTPSSGDVGLNSWTVLVTDGAATNTATLNVTVDAAPGTSPGTAYLSPIEDAFVKQHAPTEDTGSSATMNLRNSATKQMDSYLKFDVQGIGGSVTAIKLKLFSLHAHTLSVHAVADTSWDENTINWINRETIGALLASKTVTANAMIEVDLPASAVTTNGQVSFALRTDSASFRQFNTKEAGSNIPKLEVSYTGSGGENAPPTWNSDPVVEANATEDVAYSGSIADNATDDDDDPLTFAKVSGPAWLSIASGGTLSGSPTTGDVGLNAWSVSVTDGTATNTATLNISVGSDGDWDDDGIPDPWEQQYFGHATNAVASHDVDGDGFDTLSEYIAGFDPTNALSYPCITGFEILEGASNCVIRWEALTAGRAYDVLWANSPTGALLNVESNMLYPLNSYTGALNQAESAGFYRVRFKLQDAP